MIKRAPFAFILAAVVSFGIFYLMQALIATGKNALTDDVSSTFVDFVRVKKDTQVEKKERTPPKPPPPPQQPPKPDTPKTVAQQTNTGDSGFAIGNIAVDSDISIDSGFSGANSGEGDYLPIIKVAPVYPRQALRRGLEGYVLVSFTVTKLGTVIDPVVIEASPENVFNKAALAAVKKFKYKPRVVNGQAIDVAGVKNLIRFEIEK